MMDLQRYFEIAFEDERISDDDLRKFTEDHLRRLTANDPDHEFGALVTATAAAYSDFFGGISDEDTQAAVRQGLTIAMKDALEGFKAHVRRREGLIRSTWDKDSPEYTEFFPRGLNEYNQVTLGNAETLMTRFVNAATAHQATLGQPVVDEFAQLKEAFVSARTAQLEKKAAVSGSKAEAAAARAALEKQLTVNLLTLALKFVGQPEQGMAFFDQSIIRPASGAPPAAPAPEPAL